MSDDHWNDDVAYVFSMHRTVMQVLGIWPLEKKTILQMMRWSISTFLQWTVYVYLFMGFTGNHSDTDANMEAILFLSCTTSMATKYLCITMNREKLARIITIIIDDWFLAKNEEETYKIMKKYAFASRLSTSFIVYSTYICTVIYSLVVILLNLKQIYLQDSNASNGTDINTINWIYLVPTGTLGLTVSQYIIIIIHQELQIVTVCMVQCVIDSLYISIILHLSCQLKVLETKFKAFAIKSDTEINHQKELCNLIDRHCKLTKFNQNIEDMFHLVILVQLSIVTVLLALLGLRITLCLKNNDYIELAKSSLMLNFIFMEVCVYSFGGDFVQKGSENIFHAMYAASWYTLPAILMKDVHFIMMRSSYPFRLSGGKFFYVNRETIVQVLKAAASYVSVLRLALID